MDFRKVRPVYVDYLLILAGTAIMALAINSVYDPSSLVTGGFTGAGIILKEVTSGIVDGGIPLWLTNIMLNVPVFLLGAKIKGMRFLKRTLFATVMLSAWLYILPVVSLGVEDLILSSLFGGAIFGVGIGMVFMARATTGGTDLVAALIQHYLRHYSIVQIMQIIDAAIVIVGAYTFGITTALYSILAIVVTSYISDYLIEGVKFAKVAYIITGQREAVAKAVLDELDRGLTGWDARGMYSEEHKNVLFCVVSKKEIVALKECIAEIDPKAFIVVSDAREVLGEGFLERKA